MRLLLLIILIFSVIIPVYAAEIEAPEVPPSGRKLMPESESFGQGLLHILKELIPLVRPDLHEASGVCLMIIGTTLLASILQGAAEHLKLAADIASVAGICIAVLAAAGSMIRLAADTVTEMTEYGKLLFPVLTAALAAQGAMGTSAALYAGTTAVTSIISSIISGFLTYTVYIFLAVSIAAATTGEGLLKKIRDLIKTCSSWALKTILTAFTAYMGITGVISGTADAAALKATKAAISTAVPVVGGILSDASEAVLISVAMAKNAAGIYGIFAILAIFLEPFLLIGCHYLMLKITYGICSVFGSKNITELINDFSSGMGMLLGMTGSVCLLMLIGSICFLKGVS